MEVTTDSLNLKTVWKKKDKNIKANPGTTFFKLRLLNDKEHIYTERSGVPNFDLAGVYYSSNVRAITRYHLHLRPVLGFILSCVPNFSVLLKTQNLWRILPCQQMISIKHNDTCFWFHFKFGWNIVSVRRNWWCSTNYSKIWNPAIWVIMFSLGSWLIVKKESFRAK